MATGFGTTHVTVQRLLQVNHDDAASFHIGGTSYDIAVDRISSRWRLNFTRFESQDWLAWNSRGSDAIPSDGDWISVSTPLRDDFSAVAVTYDALPGIGRLEAITRLRDNSCHDVVFSAGIRFNRAIQASLTLGSLYLLPSAVSIFYHSGAVDEYLSTEGGILQFRTALNMYRTGLEARLWPGVSLSYSRTVGDFAETSPDRDVEFHAIPSGEMRSNAIRFNWVSKDGFQLTAAYEQGMVDGSLRFYSHDDKFGHWGIVDAELSISRAGLEWPGWHLFAEYGDFRGNIAGQITPGPFTEGLAVFLGERRHVIADGNLNWYRLAVGRGGKLASWLHMHSIVDFYSLRPRARLTTWRPALYGFGVDDLRHETLDITGLHLMRITVTPQIRYSVFHLTARVSQWIPLGIEQRFTPDAQAEDPPPSPAPAGESQVSKNESLTWWDGFSFSLQISLRW